MVQAGEQLIHLKTRTGIGQWNILCRSVFCLQLHQWSPPTPVAIPADSNVEMTWQVFGGEAHGQEKGARTVAPTVQAGEQFIHLKTRTGIGQWNILCRSVFCLQLHQRSPPTPVAIPADSNVEMTWQVFGGEMHELYLALLKERYEQDGVGTADEVLVWQFRLPLHRGIAYLATPHFIRSLSDLIRLAVVSDDGAGR